MDIVELSIAETKAVVGGCAAMGKLSVAKKLIATKEKEKVTKMLAMKKEKVTEITKKML